MRLRTILIGIAVIVATFVGATIVMQILWPVFDGGRQPVLAKTPPLPPAIRTSVIVAPIEIPLTAIRDALEAHAPRNLTGRREHPMAKLLAKADISWSLTRGPLAVYGKPETLAVTTGLSGVMRATGKISDKAAGEIGGVIGGLLGEEAGKSLEKLAGNAVDQRADIRGNVIILSEPKLTPAWRFEPKLTPMVGVVDAGLTIAGTRMSVVNEVKPLLERQVHEQVERLQTRLRTDPFLEQAARREWAKLCRSVPVGAAGAGLPNLWLELRPTRAIAAQPRITTETVTLLLGIEAETRVLPKQTRPDCPFPAQLALVPETEKGGLSVALPIDIPFTEVNRLMEAQFAGRSFPADKGSAFQVTVRHVTVAASGNRLLISLRVRAVEGTSWLGLGTETTVYVWGRPVLDRAEQVVRLADVALDLESEGFLGGAARAAAPHLEKSLAERAVIDLKPFAAQARKSIEAAIADFRGAGEGVKVDATVTGLRVVEVAFDATALRIVAEAEGAAKVSVTQLPK